MDLSIIIPTLNTKEVLKKCLASIYKKDLKLNYEVIVVDNGSKDGTADMIRREFPKTNLVMLKTNLGFGGGNNAGIEKAKGKYVLLLNSDTEIIDGAIFYEMLGWMDEHPKAGIAGCALLNKDGSYQGSGGYFPTLARIFFWMSFLDDIPFLDRIIKPYHPMHAQSFLNKNEEYFKKAHMQDWVTGAFFLIRRKVVDEVGLFDEDYFAYVEEVDYCLRAKKVGWEVWYLPKWRIIHYGRLTSGNEFAIIGEFKELKRYYAKHEPNWKMPILRFLLKLGSALRILIFGKVYAKAFTTI